MKNFIIKLELFIVDTNDNYPIIGKPLLIIWNILHRLKFIIEKNIFTLKNQLYNSTIIKLNPQDIYIPKKIKGSSNIPVNTIVDINKNGQIILVDGVFWVKLAERSNINIKVIVKNRHKKWIKFKEELTYLSRHSNLLYQKLTHPDLQEFQFTHGNTRFKLIKENLSVSKGTLLDIGTNLGYFCHMMEDLGFDCYGVEENMYYTYFLKKLRKAGNKKFKIIQKSIFSYNKGKELKFDVVLALFIFHHFLKRKNTYLNLIKLLNRLKVKEMFFGAHNPKELQNIDGYVNYNPEEFVNFIIKNSCLNKYELIGIIENNSRHIYKLTC